MRHGKKVNHLSRTKSHRDALLKNLAISLVKAKRIETTLAKAKALRMYVEPLLTKAKNDSTHSRRTVFSYLQDKDAVKILFSEIAEKIAERNGGYTRIIKLGQRQGDNAEVAMIELVDFNENLVNAATSEESASKRSRRGKKKVGAVANEGDSAVEVVEEPKVNAVFAEEVVIVEEAAVVEEIAEAEEVAETEILEAEAAVAEATENVEEVKPDVESTDEETKA